MAKQATEPRLPKYSQHVLRILQDAGKPLTAYEVLDQLRPFGAKAPPTAYRSLTRLVEAGLIHRLESLNAFVACSRGEAHGPSAFAVCTDCNAVVEMKSETVPGYLEGWAEAEDFSISSVTIEVLGLCRKCNKKLRTKTTTPSSAK